MSLIIGNNGTFLRLATVGSDVWLVNETRGTDRGGAF